MRLSVFLVLPLALAHNPNAGPKKKKGPKKWAPPLPSSVSASSAGGISRKPIHQHVDVDQGRSNIPAYDGDAWDIMLCVDGTFIEVETGPDDSPWYLQPFQYANNTCEDHGGRKACPHSNPYQCNVRSCGPNHDDLCCVASPSDCGRCCGQFPPGDPFAGLCAPPDEFAPVAENNNASLCGVPTRPVANSKTQYCMNNNLTAPFGLCDCFIVYAFMDEDCTGPCPTSAPTVAPTAAPPITTAPTPDGKIVPVDPGTCPLDFLQARVPNGQPEPNNAPKTEFCLFTNETYCPAKCTEDTLVPGQNLYIECDGGCGYVPDSAVFSDNTTQIGGNSCPLQQPLCPVAGVKTNIVLSIANSKETLCDNPDSFDGLYYYYDRLRPSTTRNPPCFEGTQPCGYSSCQFDCLRNHPGEQWFYFRVTKAGTVSFSTRSLFDHDFAVWGPYGDLPDSIEACPSYPNYGNRAYGFVDVTGKEPNQIQATPSGAPAIYTNNDDSSNNRFRQGLLPNIVPQANNKTKSCSFSPSNVEEVLIPYAPIGYYTMLFSNYANVDQELVIKLGPTNTAEYDCDFLKRCDGTNWNIKAVNVGPDDLVTPEWLKTEYNNGFVEPCPNNPYPQPTQDFFDSNRRLSGQGGVEGATLEEIRRMSQEKMDATQQMIQPKERVLDEEGEEEFVCNGAGDK